eukprot:TRINITY_DN8515_c0_g1_i2.p1 TRINITY_DN8515_c0_g1~~TRINITY_DN8515_c0_g1_i2.p1  ORF type:complete len:916 (+),score=160.58 TRINITY_DN8515_c0_g1_i2:65-2812(+)
MSRSEANATERRAAENEYTDATETADDLHDDSLFLTEEWENESDATLATQDIAAARLAALLPKITYEGVFLEAKQQEEIEMQKASTETTQQAQWRLKDRAKTVNAALVLCLNIGVDPPDLVKIPPCAKLECWTDPHQLTSGKAIEIIGKNLQTQFERLQQKARFKQCLDPTIEDVKKLCVSLRRSAKDDRVLFFYNGHGVPRPTTSGEVWVFNKEFTQYIPLSILDLQNWIATPVMYVFDCSASGVILQSYLQYTEQRERELELRAISSGVSPTETPSNILKDTIFLTACGSNETLPTNPNLPADFFTSCLTTPLRIALRCFAAQSTLFKITEEMADLLPGRLSDRKTPLGELNWILTAVTDTIAWNAFPKELFQKLFRQDVLVASLMRNFLLAERLMRTYRCTPMSHPKLPSTYGHPAWNSWDMAVEHYLLQLPGYLQNPARGFRPSRFFHEQLTAFQVWLDIPSEHRKPPEQLPIVLQVLLSQNHRARALRLISRFVNLGTWAVHTALSVGIFPYILRLLQSASPEVRDSLVNIWSRILLVDKSCQAELLKENGLLYFYNILAHPESPPLLKVKCAFILSKIVNNLPAAQSQCLSIGLIPACINQTQDNDSLLRQWLCMCLGKLWENHEEAKKTALRENSQDRLLTLLSDNIAQVRAAALYALGTLIGSEDHANEQRMNQDHSIALGVAFAKSDVSVLVRQELIITLSKLVNSYKQGFCEYAYSAYVHALVNGNHDDRDDIEFPPEFISLASKHMRQKGTTYAVIWDMIQQLLDDPVPSVSQLAETIVLEVSRTYPRVHSPDRGAMSALSPNRTPKQPHANRKLSTGSDKPSPGKARNEPVNLRKNISSQQLPQKDESGSMKKVSSLSAIIPQTKFVEQGESPKSSGLDVEFTFPESVYYDHCLRNFSNEGIV